MIGIKFPILVAIIEYGILLAMEKYHAKKNSKVYVADDTDLKDKDWILIGKTVDKWTFAGSLLFIIVFNSIYWIVGYL